MPRLSVIVVNWNGRHLLQDCIGSLLNQNIPGIEVILVDNGSTDGSADYVRDRFPGVKILELKQNFGFAAGNNRGIEASTGEFIALLNNDAVADPGWAEHLLSEAESSGAGIVASKVVLDADRGLLDSAGDGMTTAGAPYKRGHLEPASGYVSAETVFGASGCALLLRRSMLDDIGPLDEDFFLIYEDSDLCFRAQLRGWRCRYSPGAVVYHKLNTSIGKLSRVHVFYGQRNAEYLYLKNMPGWLVWRYLPVHLINALLAFAYFSSRGQCIGFVQSKIDFLRNVRKMMAKRREIQRRRTVPVRELDRMLNPRWLRSRLAGK